MPGGRRAVWASKLLFSVFPSRELALMMAEPWAQAERKDKQGAEPDDVPAGSGRVRYPVFGIAGQERFV